MLIRGWRWCRGTRRHTTRSPPSSSPVRPPLPSASGPTLTRFTRSDPDLILDADKHPSGKTLHIYLGDRWNGHGENGGVGNASYVWLPLVPEPSSPAKFSMPPLNGGGNGEWQIAKY